MKLAQNLSLIIGALVVAACQPSTLSSTSASVSVPAVVVAAGPPPAPLPPLGAAAGLTIPTLGDDGLRKSPNKGIGPEETLWHVRSSYNVAALTCQGSTWGRLASDYNAFIKKHDSRLGRANRAIEAKFQREKSGRAGRRTRDTHVTSLYNYFSLPPVKNRFCSTMVEKANEMSQLSSGDLKAYAQTALPQIDNIFTDFYDAYEAYEKSLADWHTKYGDQTVDAKPVADSAG